MKDLVSIIIRSKDEEKWIGSCLKSIFNQNYNNFEVILVDNYSKDKTISIAKKFNILLKFGIGGNHKESSSSDLLGRWEEYIKNKIKD